MNAFRVAPAALRIVGLSLVRVASRQSFGYGIHVIVPIGLADTERNSSVDLGSMDMSFSSQVTYSAEESGDLPDTHRVTVPEPSGLVLLAVGAPAFGVWARCCFDTGIGKFRSRSSE